MQENALHGWRLGDAASMHMAGYPSKPRSLAWAQKGRWLVTAGADRVVCWPFLGKSGPMNKSALELGPGGLLVTRVATHPSEDAIAAGYEDGSVLLLRLADDKSVVVQAAPDTAPSARSPGRRTARSSRSAARTAAPASSPWAAASRGESRAGGKRACRTL